ncbi:MAG: hypothetical protein IJ313_00565 [Clostridia bacterium]|nr:hypothetical protein [Clostridia bacterium]
MIDVNKARGIIQALRCSEHQAGHCFACYQTACPGKDPYELNKDAAEMIEELLADINRRSEERMVMMVQMHGDCGVCVRRDQRGGVCASCLMDEAHPNWEYEGSLQR